MIHFEIERKGYNKEQVNEYLENVQKQYRVMQEEYKSLLNIAKELRDANALLKKQNTALKEDQKRFIMSSQEKTALIAETVKQAEQVARLAAKKALQETAFATRQPPTAASKHIGAAAADMSESEVRQKATKRKQDSFAKPVFSAISSDEQVRIDEITKLFSEVDYKAPTKKAGEG